MSTFYELKITCLNLNALIRALGVCLVLQHELCQTYVLRYLFSNTLRMDTEKHVSTNGLVRDFGRNTRADFRIFL